MIYKALSLHLFTLQLGLSCEKDAGWALSLHYSWDSCVKKMQEGPYPYILIQLGLQCEKDTGRVLCMFYFHFHIIATLFAYILACHPYIFLLLYHTGIVHHVNGSFYLQV